MIEQAIQVLRQMLRSLIPLIWNWGEALANDTLQAPRSVIVKLSQRRNRSAALSGHRFEQNWHWRVTRLVIERVVSRDHFKHHHAKPVNVRPVIDRLDQFATADIQGPQMFRCHVSDCPPKRRFHLSLRLAFIVSQIEIQQHRCAVTGDQNIGRLDVTVQHSAIMSVL